MASLLDETTHLHEQVRLKEEELAKLREEMKEKEKKKQEVIHELLGTNKQEACRHERTQRTVDTLRKSVKEKQKLINEMESRANDLQVQINGLQQSLSDKKAGISRAEDEIATLQRAI
ncbi:hypothetical protein SI65_09046 [Aspergillus cristatus]|uniref:Uncharacterized protein n=1 Tax=Aspergillus cristatus TaxID=573508 RepID=A0A1E3B3B7_ASPCR|nr:hypothetical protein SI65_09046 [Aspergillus cristatus]